VPSTKHLDAEIYPKKEKGGQHEPVLDRDSGKKTIISGFISSVTAITMFFLLGTFQSFIIYAYSYLIETDNIMGAALSDVCWPIMRVLIFHWSVTVVVKVSFLLLRDIYYHPLLNY
jgi:hypothetical protein